MKPPLPRAPRPFPLPLYYSTSTLSATSLLSARPAILSTTVSISLVPPPSSPLSISSLPPSLHISLYPFISPLSPLPSLSFSSPSIIYSSLRDEQTLTPLTYLHAHLSATLQHTTPYTMPAFQMAPCSLYRPLLLTYDTLPEYPAGLFQCTLEPTPQTS